MDLKKSLMAGALSAGLLIGMSGCAKSEDNPVVHVSLPRDYSKYALCEEENCLVLIGYQLGNHDDENSIEMYSTYFIDGKYFEAAYTHQNFIDSYDSSRMANIPNEDNKDIYLYNMITHEEELIYEGEKSYGNR